jgi:V-type H+-transporting ATPase subunit a
LLIFFSVLGTVDPKEQMYSGQAFVQQLLLYVALICVPWMLIAKPYTLWREHQKKVKSGYRTVSGGVETGEPREEEDQLIQGEEEGEGHEEGGEGEHVSLTATAYRSYGC